MIPSVGALDGPPPCARASPAAGAGSDAPARGADQAHPLAWPHGEVQALVDDAAGAGIAKAHCLEGDRGLERGRPACRGILHLRLFVEDAVDALGRRHAHHALMQHRAQLAHGPEDLHPQHQDDQQAGQLQSPGLHAPGPQGQGGGRAAGNGRVGDASPQHIAAQHPHGALKQLPGLDRQVLRAGAALPEGLQRRQALYGVEELGGKGGVGLLQLARAFGVALVPERRGEECDQGEEQHDAGHRQVDEGDAHENEQRREQGDQELRQVLAEVGFQLLHAVNERRGQRARALPADGARPQSSDAVVDRPAQALLHPSGSFMRQHDPPVLEGAAEQHDKGDEGNGQRQGGQLAAGEDLTDQPAQQAEPRHAETHGQQADQHRPKQAQSQALGEGPKPWLEMHLSLRLLCFPSDRQP